MKLSPWQLDHQDGPSKFVPHDRPDQPSLKPVEINLPERMGGRRTVQADTSEHASHTVEVETDIGLKEFQVLCDGTIISAED